MYGDTLVEAWRGTFLGEPAVRAQGCADVFHNQFGVRYRAAALGIAGDSPVSLSIMDVLRYCVPLEAVLDITVHPQQRKP